MNSESILLDDLDRRNSTTAYSPPHILDVAKKSPGAVDGRMRLSCEHNASLEKSPAGTHTIDANPSPSIAWRIRGPITFPQLHEMKPPYHIMNKYLTDVEEG